LFAEEIKSLNRKIFVQKEGTINMMKKLTIFEKAFDNLFSIPYLKRIMKSLWWFQVFYTPVCCLLGILKKGPEFFVEPSTVKMLLSYLFGMVVFGYMFYQWDLRDKERETSH